MGIFKDENFMLKLDVYFVIGSPMGKLTHFVGLNL